MKLRLSNLIAAAFIALGSTAWSQTLLLDDFGSGTTTGQVIPSSSWFNQLTQTSTSLIVGGTALSDSGWQAINLTLPDLSGYHYLALSAQLSATNAALNIFVTFDGGLNGVQTFAFPASSFSVSSMTTVYVPVVWTIIPTTVEAWNIGGGYTPPGTGSPAFQMTFDNLALTTSAVPEPGTYAALTGLIVLGFAVWRRRAVRTS
jgi:hypothetical protein